MAALPTTGSAGAGHGRARLGDAAAERGSRSTSRRKDVRFGQSRASSTPTGAPVAAGVRLGTTESGLVYSALVDPPPWISPRVRCPSSQSAQQRVSGRAGIGVMSASGILVECPHRITAGRIARIRSADARFGRRRRERGQPLPTRTAHPRSRVRQRSRLTAWAAELGEF